MFQNIATDLTFNGVEARDLILGPAFARPLARAIMTIHEGIKAKMIVAFAERISKITHLDEGCGSTPGATAIRATQKTWNPRGQEMWVAECYTNLYNTYLTWGLGVGYDRPNLEKATISVDGVERNLWTEFVLELMQDAAAEDFLRITFLADETITAARLTNGAGDVKNYNQVDGFFKQVFAIVGARKYAIAANAGAAGAQDLPAEESRRIFNALATKADPRLKSDPNRVYLTTQSVLENWMDYRESKNLETSFAEEAEGTTNYKYRGVGIYGLEFLDRHLAADFTIAGRVDLPHRVLFTTTANLAAGVDAEGAIQGFESHYEWVAKKMHLRGMYMLDALVMRDYLVAAAY